MPDTVYKEEKKKEEEREEEHKRKKREIEGERSPEMESKKSDIEKGSEKSMSFGEARPLTEVKYVKTPIHEVKGAEKYEPVIKEDIAVKLVEEEKKKEENKAEAIKSESVAKEEHTREERVREETERERATTEKTNVERAGTVSAEINKEKEGVSTPEMKRIARDETIRREILKKERDQLSKLVEEARERGMKEPTKEIASKLFEYYTNKGLKPSVALGRVILSMKKLGLLKKKDTKGIRDFLKSLFPK